jgi:uncharacterized protein with NAD-binding domain and iron-sulfur cluster
MTVKQSDRRFGAFARSAALLAVLLGGGLALSACKSNTEGTAAAYADDEPAGDLYNEGLAYMNAGKMRDAIKSFEEVDRQHPYSEHARKALVMSAPMPLWQIVKEKRATFAATPAQDARRPMAKTGWPNMFLAGDWTQTGLPATIEGALQSGETAAALALKHLSL